MCNEKIDSETERERGRDGERDGGREGGKGNKTARDRERCLLSWNRALSKADSLHACMYREGE